jgi:hypothetical protein
LGLLFVATPAALMIGPMMLPEPLIEKALVLKTTTLRTITFVAELLPVDIPVPFCRT